MNVEAAVAKVDWYTAHEKFREYREVVKSGRAQPGDEALRQAYREISRGKKVLDLNLAIAGGGLTTDGVPKLAIAGADWPWCNFRWWERRALFTKTRIEDWSRRDRRLAQAGVMVPMTTTPPTWNIAARAQVPSIPPSLRPSAALSNYAVLFEAVWQKAPPVDPILLRHLEGPFYLVLAQWDLTPLEQSVLRARL